MRGGLAIIGWVSLVLAIGCPVHTDVMAPDDDDAGGAADDDDESPGWPDVQPMEADDLVPVFPEGPCEDYPGIASLGDIWSTPREQADLERLALLLEPQRLVASDETYERVVRDVTAIRSQAPDLAHIEFRPWDDGQRLFIRADDEDVQAQMISGEYDAWTCPNLYYAVTDIAEYNLTVVVLFKGAYNMALLEPIYAQMPDVGYVGLSGQWGDGPTICADRDGDLMHYVFDDASGDCPAGCIYHDYTHYTTDTDGEVTWSGEWASDDEDPEPEWVSICEFTPENLGW